MIKRFTILFCFSLMTTFGFAQLPSGSIAPNFTGTDLDGNTWELYELLDQGKSVILDFSATWCGPCWSYHEGGAFKELYNTYGPDGTDELMVFFIEGDASTTLDDLNGLTANTQGDWVTGTPYPIIDNDAIAADYQIAYWPTLYHVCPSRTVTEFEQIPASEIYALLGNCPTAFGDNNLGAILYDGLEGSFCSGAAYSPSFSIQNLGAMNATSAEIELRVNGMVVQTQSWTGDLSTFATDVINFDDVTLTDNSTIEIVIVSVNGTDDEAMDDNTITVDLSLAPAVSNNTLTLEIKTDFYPGETYWQIVDDNDLAYYTGGNDQVIGGLGSEFYSAETEYIFDLPLPADGCFEFRFFDGYGDGISDPDFGGGYFYLKDADGNVLVDGSSFASALETFPFSLESGQEVLNNAAIVASNNETQDFCFDLTYTPEITIQNIGANEITSLKIEVLDNNSSVYTKDWTGSIASGSFGFVTLDPIDITQPETITTLVTEVNGEIDANLYKNTTETALNQRSGKGNANLEIRMPIAYAYEWYWEFINSSGDILASGGNEVVKQNGAGALVAAPGDPGAYADGGILHTESVMIDATDCYALRIIDDYNDGGVSPDDSFDPPYFTITDEQGNAIYDQQSLFFFFGDYQPVVGMESSVSVEDIKEVSELSVFPNPTADELTVVFNTTDAVDMEVSILNTLGQQVRTIAYQEYTAGQQQVTTNVSNLPNGVYFVQLANANGKEIKKFTVLH